MTDVRQIELLNAIRAEEQRRRNLRQKACSTCRDWHDVIHANYDGRLAERWHSWPEPDHACPACGREPEVFVLRWAFDPGETPDPEADWREHWRARVRD